jgi:molybdopterin-guanine dinucleotide biosynthesis protein A
VPVAFDRPNDDPLAFANVNTLADLHALETTANPAQHP